MSYHNTVKSAGLPVLILRLHILSIFIKNFQIAQITFTSVLSYAKTILSLLELIGHMVLISECFAKTKALDCDEKFTQSVTEVTM